MADRRNRVVEKYSAETADPSGKNWLSELPKELIKPGEKQQDPSIIGVMPNKEAKAAIRNLSETSKSLRTLFNPEPEKRIAKRLLEYVLQGNEAKVVEMAKWKPELFYVKSTAQDYAMDLKGNRRTIKEYSPIQAMVATGDKNMFEAVKSYLDKSPADHQRIRNHIKEKFPNGINYPPCTDEFDRLIDAVATAIGNDQQLKNDWTNPNAATLQALEAFRDYLKPGIVEKGHHYNLSNFVKTEELYGRYWHPWSDNQLSFFLVKVMAFQQRLCTAYQQQVNRTGLDYYFEKNNPLIRGFKIHNDVTDKDIDIFPLDREDPSCRLGDGFYVENVWGRATGKGFCGGPARRYSLLQNYIERISRAFKVYSHTEESNNLSMCVRH